MKFFQRNELKLLWIFYLEAFLGTLFYLTAPFSVIYFSSIGLNFFQIGVIFSAYSLSVFIFEIPTGAFADLYGRKASVRLSFILEGIFLLIIFFIANFYILVLLFFLRGFARTFQSGSYDAWVVDSLKRNKKSNYIHDFFTKMQSFYSLAFIFSGILGSLAVFYFGLKSIWIFTGLSCFLSLFIISFPEEKFKKRTIKIRNSFTNLCKQTKNSISHGYSHPVLFFLIIIAFIFGIGGSFEGLISWTSLLKNYNFPDYGFGYLWSALGVAGILAPLISKLFLKKNKEKIFLITVSFLVLIYGLLVLSSNFLGLLLVLAFAGYFLVDMQHPVQETYFNKFIPSKMRATIISIKSMVISLATIIGAPLAGFVVDKFGGKIAVFIFGLSMMPIIVLYLLIDEFKKIKKSEN